MHAYNKTITLAINSKCRW